MTDLQLDSAQPHKSQPLSSEPKASRWWRAWLILLIVLVAWNAAWLAAITWLTDAQEFSSDYRLYKAYLRDPWLCFGEGHKDVLGASVAAPCLPLEMAAVDQVLGPSMGLFVALRLTFIAHAVVGTAIGLACTIKWFLAPSGVREWFYALITILVPVGWVGGAITAQDDSLSALWSGLILLAFAWYGPASACFATGLGMFFAKPFLVVHLVGLWIGSPGRRWRTTIAASLVVLAFATFLLWRDGTLTVFGGYNILPYMGPNPFAATWLLGVRLNKWVLRDYSAFFIVISALTFIWYAYKRRLTFMASTCGLYSLFLAFYMGAMPEYAMWYLPITVLVLWAAVKQRAWATFWFGWLHSFLGYSYKMVYGFNPRFANSGKPGLKNWYLENIGWNLDWLQILVALATVGCAITFAILLLHRDPTKNWQRLSTEGN